jgi:hypothetical protein
LQSPKNANFRVAFSASSSASRDKVNLTGLTDLTDLMLNLTNSHNALILSLTLNPIDPTVNLVALTHNLTPLIVNLTLNLMAMTLNLTALTTTHFAPPRFDRGTSEMLRKSPGPGIAPVSRDCRLGNILMDVYEYLKQLPVRSNNRLEPYRAEIRILYSGNASFSAIRKYLRDNHGVSVTTQSVWEYCKRHFSELAPARLTVNLSGATHEARQSQVLSGPARDSLDAHDTQSSHQQATVATASSRTPEFQPVQPEPVCSVNAPQPPPVVHNAALAPTSQTSSVQSLEPRVEGTRAHAANNDVESTNESQMHRSFTQEPENSPGNIVQADASRRTEDDAPVDIELFGPAGNLRKPHDLDTPAAKERLARLRKARAEGKI